MSTFSDKYLISIIWGYIHPHKKLFYSIFVIMIFTLVISFSSPLLFYRVIAMVESGDFENINIVSALLLYLIFGISNWFINVILFLLITRLNAKFIRDIRIDAYQRVIQNKISFFDNQKSGNLTSRLVYDTRELNDTSIRFAWFVISLFQVLITVVILYSFSFRIAFATSLAIPVVLFFSIYLARIERRMTDRWRDKFSTVNHKFSEIMSKIQISKTFNREKENLKNFRDINEQTYKASVKRGLAIFIFWPVTDLFKHTFTFITLIVGSREVQNGLPLTTFILFLVLINYFYWPLIGLSENYKSIQDIFASLTRLSKISYDNNNHEINNGKVMAAQLDGEVVFNNVSFAYTNDNPVLQNLNFTVRPGMRVALVGHTGAGKSTIGSLLMRFYNITGGEILVDNRSIYDYDLNSYRENISIVSQKVLLFRGTIRDNLQLSDQKLSDEELWSTLEKVQAKEFIENLPDGLDTVVEENGKNLSAGEKQMISFARAILSDPKIIIFDEATSAVDLYTESKILDAIDAVLEGRTAISIAHRLTTILNSDLIIMLSDGKIIEMGSHDELLLLEGHYHEMYNIYLQTQSAIYLNKIIK